MGFWGDVGLDNPLEVAANVATGGMYGMNKGLANGADRLSGGKLFGDPGADAEKQRKAMLAQQAAAAGGFANYGQSQFQGVNQGMTDYRKQLQALASGQNSLSSEQLRQGLGQQLAQQQAMAASANPNNAAMAARNAAQNMARASYGMSGQAAMAGIQERNQANQLLGSALANQGNMNLQAALQSRQNAMNGYGAGMQGAPDKSWLEKYGPMIIGAGQTAASAMA